MFSTTKKITIVFLLLTTCVMFPQKTWVGTAGDGMWGTDANWSGGTAPTASDSVVIDNSAVANNYTVTLPGGAVMVKVKYLVVSPNTGNTITVTLPASNTYGSTTSDAGLVVGDNTTSNYDIVLKAGATLINASGAGAGFGISLSTPSACDKMVIYNGATYIHNTVRSDGGVNNSTAADPTVVYLSGATETGVFKYLIPGNSAYTMNLGNRSFGCSLVVDRENAGTITTTSVNSASSVFGSFTVSANVTFSVPSGASSVLFYRDITINGAASFLNTQGIKIYGTTGSGFTQLLSGTGSLSTAAFGKQTNPILKLGMNVTISAGTAPAFTINGQVDCGMYKLLGNYTVSAGTSPTIKSAHPYGFDSSIATTGTINLGTGASVVFNGTTAQTTGIKMPATLASLTINNPAGVTMSAPVTVATKLTLTNGVVTTTTANMITFGSSCALVGGSTTAYISGPFACVLASTAAASLTFPIGKGIAYRPVVLSITQDAVTSTIYTAEVFNSAPVTRTLPGGILQVSPIRYVNIMKSAGAGITSATVKLSYDLDDQVTDAADIRVLKDDGASNWLNLGGVGTANITGTVSSTVAATSLGDFGIGHVSTLVGIKNDVTGKSFELKQNYPNPFNPSTKISFSIASEDKVSLTIYDVMGREIRTLIDDVMGAGLHSVVWNGKDNLGSSVASGTYIYKLSTDKFVQSKKMIFVK